MSDSKQEARKGEHFSGRPWWVYAVAVLAIIGAIGAGWKFATSATEQRKPSDATTVHRNKLFPSQEAIVAHRIFLGMTRDEVRRSWGDPREIERGNDSYYEKWRYPEHRVHFEKGRVTHLENLR